MNENSWIGFDLDSTLAHYDGWDGGRIGKPIWPMVNLLKHFLDQNIKCKIFTARVCQMREDFDKEKEINKINEWCQRYIGQTLEITHEKDWAMVLLIDDRVVAVEPNTGVILHKPRDIKGVTWPTNG